MHANNICRFNKYNSLCHIFRSTCSNCNCFGTIQVQRFYLRFRPPTFYTKLTVYWVMVNNVNNVIRLPAFPTHTHTHFLVYFNCLPLHFSALSPLYRCVACSCRDRYDAVSCIVLRCDYRNLLRKYQLHTKFNLRIC